MEDNKMEKNMLSVSISAAELLALSLKAVNSGEEKVNFAFFENEKSKENSPNFKNDKLRGAVWAKKYLVKDKEVVKEEVIGV